MPIGVNSIELPKYFRQPENEFGKSIQRNWQFYGFFLYSPFKSIKSNTSNLVNNKSEFPPEIQTFHILDVTIPTYKFRKEKVMYGQVPRTFPVLDFEGFNLSVTLEEDEFGTVERFINWNQRNIIDSRGYYNAPNNVKTKAFYVEVQDKNGAPVVYYIFKDLYFLEASDASYSYNSNESIKRTLTFGCDMMSTEFVEKRKTTIRVPREDTNVITRESEYRNMINVISR